MTSRIALFLLAVLVAAIAVATFSLSSAKTRSRGASVHSFTSNAAPQEGQVERGKYLVEQVAECGECHSPRDASGNPDHSRWLQGAPVWIMPVHPDPNWAERVPGIAGMQGYTDDQMQKILEQGIGPNGLPLRRPMHTYHMKHDDAVAIITYLRTLPAGLSPE